MVYRPNAEEHSRRIHAKNRLSSGTIKNARFPAVAQNRAGCILQSTDELGAQVALLQSPTLPAVTPLKTEKQKKKTISQSPVDKPHT